MAKKVFFDDVETQLCPDLKPVEDYLRREKVAVGHIYRNDTDWFKYFRTVVEVEVVLLAPALRKKLKLPRVVRNYEEFDAKTGGQYGFYCAVHKDALIGIHPRLLSSARKIG